MDSVLVWIMCRAYLYQICNSNSLVEGYQGSVESLLCAGFLKVSLSYRSSISNNLKFPERGGGGSLKFG